MMLNKIILNSPTDTLKATYKRSLVVYVFALSFLFAFIVSTFVLETKILASQKAFAKIINLSGRQRMLSQRIALFVSRSHDWDTLNKIEDNQNQIKKNLQELESIIKLLSLDNSKQNLTALNSSNSNNFWNDNKNIVNDFISSTYNYIGNKIEPNIHQIQQQQIQHIQDLALGPVLAIFDTLTTNRQTQANLIIEKIDKLKAFLTLITLVLLLLETFFIFFPLAKSNFKMSLQNLAQHDEEIKLKNFSNLGLVISKIVHEINNPLTVIMIKIKYLKKHENFDPEVNQSLDIIDKNITRVSKIIKSTKSIYRSGKNDELTKVSLKQVIEEAIDATKILKDTTNLNIELSADEDFVIEAQEHQIFQVISNLITNAVDAVESVDPKNISVSLLRQDSGALIRISDNGPGVPPQLDQKIFEQLFTTKSHGTGIGLHESKMIIEAYSGTIRLNRAISNSTFEIFLPNTISL